MQYINVIFKEMKANLTLDLQYNFVLKLLKIDLGWVTRIIFVSYI